MPFMNPISKTQSFRARPKSHPGSDTIECSRVKLLREGATNRAPPEVFSSRRPFQESRSRQQETSELRFPRDVITTAGKGEGVDGEKI